MSSTTPIPRVRGRGRPSRACARLQAEFGDGVAITYVMAGLAREFERPGGDQRRRARRVRRERDAGRPAGVARRAPQSSYPACMAVKAAAEQGLDGPYLRRRARGADGAAPAARHARRAGGRRPRVPGLDRGALRASTCAPARSSSASARTSSVRAASPEHHERPRVPFPSFESAREHGGRRATGERSVRLRATRACARRPPGDRAPAAGVGGGRAALRAHGDSRGRRRPATCPGRAPRPSSGGWRPSGGCGRSACSPASCGSPPERRAQHLDEDGRVAPDALGRGRRALGEIESSARSSRRRRPSPMSRSSTAPRRPSNVV